MLILGVAYRSSKVTSLVVERMISCMKRVGFFGVFDGADVVGSSSSTSERTTGEGTVSRCVRSDVCRRSGAFCFCNATVGGEFDEQSG